LVAEPRIQTERPLSPHLGIYHFSITMAMSILHRITGCALYFGTLLLVWWLLAAASSARQFDIVSSVFASWFGQLVLLGYTWALLHHMLGGIRHFIWDTLHGLEPGDREFLAYATMVGSASLTVAVWVLGYMLKG
jgi:succinate dehydrogenase / fumarate reductase, cytochrome b subunit